MNLQKKKNTRLHPFGYCPIQKKQDKRTTLEYPIAYSIEDLKCKTSEKQRLVFSGLLFVRRIEPVKVCFKLTGRTVRVAEEND